MISGNADDLSLVQAGCASLATLDRRKQVRPWRSIVLIPFVGEDVDAGEGCVRSEEGLDRLESILAPYLQLGPKE